LDITSQASSSLGWWCNMRNNVTSNGHMAIIYKITSPLGKVYVGATTSEMRFRKATHKYCSKINRGHNVLHRDMSKQGFDNFNFEVLEECSDEQRFAKERFWIAKLDSYNSGYNKTIGGLGPSGMRVTDELRKMRSKESKDKWANPKFRKKIMAAKMPSLQDSKMQSKKGKLGGIAKALKMPLFDVYDNGKYIGEFRTGTALAKRLGVTASTGRRYLDGKIGRKRLTLVRKDG
jgi:group I intron endonuclease